MLRRLIVQPVLAFGLVSLIVIGGRVLDEDVGVREVLAVAAIVVGVAGLVLTAPEQSAAVADPAVLAPVMGGLGLIALVPYVLRSSGGQLALVVVSGGLAYGLCGLATSFASQAASSDGSWWTLVLWLAATGAGAVIALISETTAFQRAPVTHVFPVILVVQIVVAVGLAPLLGGETWDGSPLTIVSLAASLAVVVAGASLIGTSAVGVALATRSGAEGSR